MMALSQFCLFLLTRVLAFSPRSCQPLFPRFETAFFTMSLRTRIAALFLFLALSSAFCPFSVLGQKTEDVDQKEEGFEIASTKAHEEAEEAQIFITRPGGSSSIWDNPPESHRDLWRWCTTQPSLIEDFDILLDPYPLRPGRNFNLHLRGILKEALPDLQLRTLIVLSRFIRISHTRNLCAENPGLCPLQPGYQELTITYAIPPVIPGPITVDATMIVGSKEIACARMGPLQISASGLGF
ncbi:ML domain protein [Toxoplasma gondii RUB]|uniref:ML domain protein n=8 Tax=Toxoplasma gondii TaxID=5811 RepID=V4YZ51_TOXGV|nr:ML domain protein [Toxoplasma gondii VEG]KFG28533.1 ML domain protein [Toxoplasma gondii p89]KFG32281.1 ML domain protein [Toxoplasma gondii GAB2-2007-GAL-DOM2]KFG57341.1 ML domain protein [Toxoplasma gondii RUB]KFH00144.1 ML domain protein [Toxoplasma gondii VAND]KFH01367.1 ML domain protein [Toxoplasma gondii MAS]PUA84085.1 ML domain protein [Toxoplasma gondii TgCATBr9]RQX72876.1 ML domain protein [Toxoplasma gondii CAST]